MIIYTFQKFRILIIVTIIIIIKTSFSAVMTIVFNIVVPFIIVILQHFLFYFHVFIFFFIKRYTQIIYHLQFQYNNTTCINTHIVLFQIPLMLKKKTIIRIIIMIVMVMIHLNKQSDGDLIEP